MFRKRNVRKSRLVNIYLYHKSIMKRGNAKFGFRCIETLLKEWQEQLRRGINHEPNLICGI